MLTATQPYNERWSSTAVEECSQLWELTPDQRAKLLELQTRIADIDHWKNDPFEVIRFLHEFQFDLDVTETKFRTSIQWRLDHKADTILEDYTPPALYNYFPLGVLEGTDKDGDPIYIERSGAADTLGLLQRFGRDEMIQQAIWGKELMTRGPWQQQQQQYSGRKRVKYFTTILDLKGLNRHHLDPRLVPVGQAVTRLVQDNYAGLGKKILVVRAPYIFRFVWNIFKHFVDPNVKELIEIATEKETEQVLEKYMDLSVLPKEIAPGKGQGRSVSCYETIWEGGPLPAPTKDDWKRRTPVFPSPQQAALDRPQQSTASLAGQVEISLAKLPPGSPLPPPPPAIPPSMSLESNTDTTTCSQDGGDNHSRNSNDCWETLPNTSPTQKNIQQAWTVTPSPVYNLEQVWNPLRFDDMARTWSLSPLQQQHMQQLRDRIQDIHHWKNDPYEVVRYYREFKGDLDAAEHAFRKMIVWRVEHRMDAFLQQYGEPNPLFQQYVPMCMLRGMDKDGDPIFLDRIGACDYNSLLRHFGQDGVTDYITFVRELNNCRQFWKPYERHLLQNKQRVRNYTVIIDLEGLTPTTHARPALLALLKRTSRISHYYAGWAKRILIVRAPPAFRLIWGLVKGYFAVHVRDLIEFAGRHSYQVLLDKYVDREVLPSVICPEEGKGGGMPGYYEHVKLEGGPIPKEAFRRQSEPLHKTQSERVVIGGNIRSKAALQRQQSAPVKLLNKDDDLERPVPVPNSPVAAKRLVIGTWDDDDDMMNSNTATAFRRTSLPRESSIRAFAPPVVEEKDFWSSQMQLYW